MPWGSIQEPSLGASLLASSLRSEGIQTEVLYLQHRLLRYVSDASYRRLADVFALNDFIFSSIFENEISSHQSQVLNDICNQLWGSNPKWRNDPRFDGPSSIASYVLLLRSHIIPIFLDDCAKVVLSMSPTLVGFSCLFDQTIPSLALAKSLNEQAPDVRIVLGGYAVSGETGDEILRVFDFVDSVVQGPGETEIVAQAHASILPQSKQAELKRLKKVTAPINQSPTPDFSDFQEELERLDKEDQIRIDWRIIPYECSRGCWWGEKSHCIFCGIASEDLGYTSKDADTVLQDLNDLSLTYGKSVFRFVDYILPAKYYSTLLPKLSANQENLRLTCELKANLSALRVDALKDAGFVEIQPGIESFSTSTLQEMGKGVTAAQNVLALKLAMRSGIVCHYNLLFGFPGDTKASVSSMVAVLGDLVHLQPPATLVEVLTTRFSPLQEGRVPPVKRATKAHHYFNVIFSREFLEETGLDLAKYCYYFEPEFSPNESLSEEYDALRAKVQKWNIRYHKRKDSFLTYEKAPGQPMTFFDSRGVEAEVFQITPEAELVYRAIDENVLSQPNIIAQVPSLDASDVDFGLNELRNKRLIFEENGRLVGLAIRRTCLAENYALDMAGNLT